MAKILSQDEVNRLIYFTVKYAGSQGIPEPEIEMIYNWAREARIDAVLLSQALCGEIAVSVVNGEVAFSVPAATGLEREQS